MLMFSSEPILPLTSAFSRPFEHQWAFRFCINNFLLKFCYPFTSCRGLTVHVWQMSWAYVGKVTTYVSKYILLTLALKGCLLFS